MTETIQDEHARMLFAKAQEDASALQYQLPDTLYGFHAQQACEKYMKALLTVCGVKYPYSHYLDRLEDLLSEKGEVLPSFPYALDDLIPFAAQHRYDYGEPLSTSSREAMAETVKLMEDHVVSRIVLLQNK